MLLGTYSSSCQKSKTSRPFLFNRVRALARFTGNKPCVNQRAGKNLGEFCLFKSQDDAMSLACPRVLNPRACFRKGENHLGKISQSRVRHPFNHIFYGAKNANL